jgi:hypothetical protein
MGTNLYGLIGLAITVVVFAVAFVVARSLAAKSKLPPLPELGPRPLAELPKYYAVKEQALAWEGGRGWNVNERPPSLAGPAPVDELILTTRLLNFCTRRSGHLALVFNFLVAAIEDVGFDPAALGPGAPQGYGLMTIITPSGRTLVVASSGFAQALKNAVAAAG